MIAAGLASSLADPARSLTGGTMKQGEELTDRIERLPAFEERVAVVLSNCSAWVTTWDSATVKVSGEILPVKGVGLPGNIEVLVSAYDEKGRVVGTGSDWFDRENYFAFDTFFVERLEIPSGCQISKVRIFPRAK
jgi:hypothetical protein